MKIYEYEDGSVNYYPEIEDLVGKVFTKVYRDEYNGERYSSGNEALIFENDEEMFIFTHIQDCCESVYIEDVEGELSYLVGSEILQASVEFEDGERKEEWDDSSTWTFYKFATIKGYVDVRWFGSSNGYYSESVDLLYKKKEVK